MSYLFLLKYSVFSFDLVWVFFSFRRTGSTRRVFFLHCIISKYLTKYIFCSIHITQSYSICLFLFIKEFMQKSQRKQYLIQLQVKYDLAFAIITEQTEFFEIEKSHSFWHLVGKNAVSNCLNRFWEKDEFHAMQTMASNLSN